MITIFFWWLIDDEDEPDDNAPLSKQIQELLGQAGLQAAAAGAATGATAGGPDAAKIGAIAGLQAAAGSVGLLGLGTLGQNLTNSLTIPQLVGLNAGAYKFERKPSRP